MARALVGVVWVAAALALLLVSGLIHLGHPVARRMIGRAVEQAVASGSPGVLRIGEIREASFGRLELTDVRYWDLEERRKALDLEHVELRLEPGSLLGEEIRVSQVRVRGASVVFQKSWRRPSEGFLPKFDAPEELRRQGKRIRVDDIAFEDVEAFAILDATPYRLHGLSGEASVQVDERATIALSDAAADLELPGDGSRVTLSGVNVTLPFAPETGGIARASGSARIEGDAIDATLTYHDRDEPPPLEVELTSKAFSRDALAFLGIEEIDPEIQPPLAGRVRLTGTFRSAEVHPDLRGAGGAVLQLSEPPSLEADWVLDEGDTSPSQGGEGLASSLLLYLLLSVLLAAIAIVQVALMVWLLRRGEGRPWWRMLPVVTSVAVWIQGARAAAASWWVLVAVYLALLLGAA